MGELVESNMSSLDFKLESQQAFFDEVILNQSFHMLQKIP